MDIASQEGDSNFQEGNASDENLTDREAVAANTEDDVEPTPANPQTYEWIHIVDILGLDKHPREFTTEDLVGRSLPDFRMWECFVTNYSKIVGFSVRIHHTTCNKQQGIRRREWVCSRQGFRRQKFLCNVDRQRRERDVTRCGCKACLHVLKDLSEDRWRVTKFIPEHNHELTASNHLQFLRSHKNVTKAQASQIKSYNYAGLRTCDIVNSMVHRDDGWENLGFIREHCYSKEVGIHRGKTIETDAEGLLGYLAAKIDLVDPTLYAKYAIDEDDRLCHIFWSDSISQRDYICFSDVLAVDTTYKTNAFNKSLVIFAGVNNHFRTCQFGFALLMNEQVETYKWVLETFIDCMHNHKPRVVVSDGDASIQAAINHCFPDAVHRICKWHLSTNSTTNIKTPEFTKAFKKLLHKHYNIPEWYDKWSALCETFDLQDNSSWVDETYEKRFRWVEKFLRNHFFSGMTTTQKCESMNSYLKRYVNSKLPLRELVRHIDIALRNIRESERHDDYISYNTEPPYPSHAVLLTYIRQLGSTLTRQVYYMVKLEIDMEASFMVVGNEARRNSNIFKLRKFSKQSVDYSVTHYAIDDHLECSCKQFETYGIPCRHLFAVMKYLNLQHVPESLIKKRFTMKAKNEVSSINLSSSEQEIPQVLHLTRYSALTGLASHMNYLASKAENSYNTALDTMNSLIVQFQRALDQDKNNVATQQHSDNAGVNPEASSRGLMRNSLGFRTKGDGGIEAAREGKLPKTPIKCGKCGEDGHNRTSCRVNFQEQTDGTNQTQTHNSQTN